MPDVYTDVNYNPEFIEDLQARISIKIAEFVNKKDSYRRFDIRGFFDDINIIKLTNYNEILTAILQCSNCYKDMEIEPIIGKVKVILNKV